MSRRPGVVLPPSFGHRQRESRRGDYINILLWLRSEKEYECDGCLSLCARPGGRYVIFSKPLVKHYSAVAVTAWAYLFGACNHIWGIFAAEKAFASPQQTQTARRSSESCIRGPAACFSVTTAVMVNSNEAAVRFVTGGELPFADAWKVPDSAVLPLAYWIVFNSCVAYGLM